MTPSRPRKTESTVTTAPTEHSRLHAKNLTLSYETRTISTELDVLIPDHCLTVIVGPNACGKSTMLRALSRLLKPQKGTVLLDGKDIHSYPSKTVATKLGLLPQASTAPFGITVADLVARGRFPHQKMLQQWSNSDEEAVLEAMTAARVLDLADRVVDELSGGQRQRVWLAMVLAQETDIMLLDEPTTFLDIAHQVEVLELCRRLNREHGRTLVAVLHDLNHAFRYADHIIAMKDGAIVASGSPEEMANTELIEQVFNLKSIIIRDPLYNSPIVVPLDSAPE